MKIDHIFQSLFSLLSVFRCECIRAFTHRILYTAGLPPAPARPAAHPWLDLGPTLIALRCATENRADFLLCAFGHLDLINGPLCWCWPTVDISLFHVLHHREVLSQLHGEGPSCIRTLILESIPFMFALKARKKPTIQWKRTSLVFILVSLSSNCYFSFILLKSVREQISDCLSNYFQSPYGILITSLSLSTNF